MPIKTQTKNELKLREDLKKACHLAYKKGLISGFDGNLSLRVNDETILITPKGHHKGLLEVEDFVLVDIEGNLISNGSKEPTSDLVIHIEAYKKRDDIKALIHAHPPNVVSLTISNIEINQPVIPDIIVSMGEIPTISYPGQDRDLECKLTIEKLEKHDTIVLDRHGAVTVGKDIFSALNKMESLEYLAKILFNSHMLGETQLLNEAQIEEAIKERHKMLGKEIKQREGSDFFKNTDQSLNLKSLVKKLIDSNSPVFQRVLNLINEIVFATIKRTSYSEKLSNSEKEQLSRELTASFLSMTLGRFTGKKF